MAFAVTDLGTLASGTAQAVGINSGGQIVGSSDAVDVTNTSVTRAFLWTPTQPNGTNGTMQDLGTLLPPLAPPNQCVGNSRAFAINSQGSVVGSSDFLDANGHAERAFLWTPTQPNGTNGTMRELGTLIPDVNFPGFFLGNSQALAINDSGQIVGFSDTAAGTIHAFLFDPATNAMFDLHTLLLITLIPNQPDSSRAFGINKQGQVVGSSDAFDANQNIVQRAFLWNPAQPNGTSGTMFDLGTLVPDPQHLSQFLDSSQAFAINNVGIVVGKSNTGQLNANGTPLQRAFYGAPLVKDLSTPSPNTQLRAINNLTPLGQAVGKGDTGGPISHGFLYDPNGPGIQDLNDPPLSSSWILEGATGINDNGQVCGNGQNTALSITDRALLLTP